MKCSVEITPVDKDGNPVGESMCRENDLFTHTFGLWLAMMFRPYDPGTNLADWSVSLPDTAGAPHNVYTWTTAQYNNLWETDAEKTGFNVGVGTGVIAADRGDTNLGAQIGTWDGSGTISQSLWLPTSGVIKFSGIVFIPSNSAITECGLAMRLYDNVVGIKFYLLAHDVFAGTPVNIAGGNFANVTYTIQL